MAAPLTNVREDSSDHSLIERAWELEALAQCFESLRAGTGARVFIEGAAGSGKSRLLAGARELVDNEDVRLLEASPSRFEREFPFGVVTHLLESVWLDLEPTERDALLAGPAAQVAACFSTGSFVPPTGGDADPYPLIHGLSWVLRNLAGLGDASGHARPLVICVDDVHWADVSSLQLLAYLAERVADLPAAMLVAARPGEPATDPHALAALKRQAVVLNPAPLSPEGVAVLVRRQFPTAQAEFCAACHRVSGGNPFLVSELLAKLRAEERPPDGSEAQLSEVVIDSVVQAIADRLREIGDVAREVVKAVAVLGDGATFQQVTRLTGLDASELAAAADALGAIGLLGTDVPLSFAHPLLRSAAYAWLAPLERSQSHQRAAEVLADELEQADRIVPHLMIGSPGDDQRAIEALRAAAAEASTIGDLGRAIALLERALSEGPAPDVRPELLSELGRAEVRAGAPGAVARLREAMAISDPPARARVALDLGQALYLEGKYAESATVLETGLGEVRSGEGPLPRDLLAAYVCAASLVGGLQPKALRLQRRIFEGLAQGPSRLQRVAVAHAAAREALHGVTRDRVRELCEVAWGAGDLAQADLEEEMGLPLLGAALVFADELERAVEICESALESMPPGSSRRGVGVARWARSWALYEQGHISQAHRDASALDGDEAFSSGYLTTVQAVLVRCHIELGSNDEAETALDALARSALQESEFGPLLLLVRSELRLAQHRPASAVQDALEAGALVSAAFEDVSPGALPWQSTAALAYLALGDDERARTLAEEELEHATHIGLTRTMIRNLRVLGLAAGGDAGIDCLREAVALGNSHPPRLEHTRALVDLGAALRRANRRADAREPLRRGLDLAHRSGAVLLASRARTELIASGARPRRPALTGVDSLTVSQQRVAELAAGGMTTRQIAELLFVTPKTVEFHLRQTYLKLGIRSRRELPQALTGQGGADELEPDST